MNDLRPCAPLSLKNLLAQELVKGLRAVYDSLLRYNTTRMLRDNESVLYHKLCRSFIEVESARLKYMGLRVIFVLNNNNNHLVICMHVAFPYCATCFGRCYPGGAALITDAKNLFEGIEHFLATSTAKELPKPVKDIVDKGPSKNGSLPMVENSVHGIERTTSDFQQTVAASSPAQVWIRKVQHPYKERPVKRNVSGDC